MSGIDAHQSSIAVWFKFRGKRCREYLGLANNRTNRVLAKKIARDIQAEIIAGTFDYASRFPSSKRLKEFSIRPSSQTLAEFARDSFLVERKINVEASTLAYYESLIRNHVYKSPLARRPICLIREEEILTEVKAGLKDNPDLTDSSRNHVIRLYRSIFKLAVRRGVIKKNPMEEIGKFEGGSAEIEPFSEDEVRAILNSCDGWEHSFFQFLIGSGLRPGEALALRWSHIDFARGLIAVRSNRRRGGEGRLKTKGSRREVHLLDPARQALLEQQPRSKLRGDLVFPNETSGLHHLDNIRHRSWRRTLCKAGVFYRSIMNCRHTYAVMVLEKTGDVRFVSGQLGHTSIEMVIEHYSRWIKTPGAKGTLEVLNRELKNSDIFPTKVTGKRGFGGERRGLGEAKTLGKASFRPSDSPGLSP